MKNRVIVLLFALLALAGPFSAGRATAEDSVCARVKIEIKQELTLERQAFDAHMKINNGVTHLSLEHVKVEVLFADKNGSPVLATSDPNDSSALFFIRVDSIENISDVSGTGTVGPGSAADIHWLIIPAYGVSNGLAEGTMYFVGATLTYTLGGEEQSTTVSPDYIFVKPMPLLVLDYFLPVDVYADDPFTPQIEPVVPFPLGVRVKNSGAGAARKLKIDSAQPEIVENEQGLLIGFALTGSEVNGNPAINSLLVDFGDIQPGASGMAHWIMTTTLSGKFVEFSAEWSHSDELGGQLTSLIDAVNTHFLVHDVLVDLPGRDTIRDFLTLDGLGYVVYESDSVETRVTDRSSAGSLGAAQNTGLEVRYPLTLPPTAGLFYLKMGDPTGGAMELKDVIRSDGKVLKVPNRWLSQTRYKSDPWQHFLNIFDSNSTGSYTLVFESPAAKPDPPVLQFIPDKERAEGQQLSFIVEASDPDLTIPKLSAAPLPAGAKFTDQGDKLGNGVAVGLFDWTPAPGQAGRYEVVFTASDGKLEDSQRVVLLIHNENDRDGDGLTNDTETAGCTNPDKWDTDGDGLSDGEEVGHTCLNACAADTDDDGYTDKVELDMGSNPCDKNDKPNYPPLAAAGPDRTALVGDLFTLDGTTSYDPDGSLITYLWSFTKIPADSALTDAALSDTASPKAAFTPDVAGDYTLRLTVDDGAHTAEDTVTVKAFQPNVAPNAEAGPDRYGIIGAPVTLDGAASYDPDHGPLPLGYIWKFLDVPVTSSLKDNDIANRTQSMASFTPDANGYYDLQLTVDDGSHTADDTVRITVLAPNVPPNADAGRDTEVSLGKSITLNGTASFDPDSGPAPLAYLWAFVGLPQGSQLSQADIAGFDTTQPTFTPDVEGTYVLALMVDDGRTVAFDNVAVTAVSQTVTTRGDLDGDGAITATDGNLLFAALGLCNTEAGFTAAADIDGDGCITLADYAEWYNLYDVWLQNRGDYDGDGDHDGLDLSAFIQYYKFGSPEADIDQDGAVNAGDVESFAQKFGR